MYGHTDSRRGAFDVASVAGILVITLVILLTFDHYGRTWDEAVHMAYGNHILRWYTSGFQDKTALTFRIDYLYGGGFDLLGALFRRALYPMDGFSAMRLFGGLIGLIGIVGTWRLARLLGGPRAGFIALVALSLTGVYYGHMFNNPKDLPFAVGYIWGLHFTCRTILRLPALPAGLGIKLAISFGLAMSVRIGGLLLLFYFTMALVAWCAYQGLTRRSVEVAYQYARHLAARTALVFAGAWIVMLVWWPWAIYSPVYRPFAALKRMSQFIDHVRDMPFAGEWISNLDAPRDYALHYLAFKLPEVVLVAFCLGVLFGAVRLARSGFRAERFARSLCHITLAFAVLFPLAYAAYKKPVLYDGLRHFLFIVPPIVVISALFLESLFRRLEDRFGTGGKLASAALILAHIVDQSSAYRHYHPHQYVHFNRFIGGLGGADGLYSTDYYGESYKEALENLAQAVRAEDPDVYLNSVYKIAGCVGAGNVAHYLPKNFVFTASNTDSPDFWVAYTRQQCHLRHPDAPVYLEVRRDGGLLTQVRDLRQSKNVAASAEPLGKPAKRRKKSTSTRRRASNGEVSDESTSN